LVINDKTYLSLVNDDGDCLPFQAQIYSGSGTGKGIFSERIIEEWKRVNNIQYNPLAVNKHNKTVTRNVKTISAVKTMRRFFDF
jgi:hypothetical protein